MKSIPKASSDLKERGGALQYIRGIALRMRDRDYDVTLATGYPGFQIKNVLPQTHWCQRRFELHFGITGDFFAAAKRMMIGNNVAVRPSLTRMFTPWTKNKL